MPSKHIKTRRHGEKKLWCSKCKTHRPRKQFHKHSGHVVKRQGWCKDCMRAAVREWKAAYKERTGEVYS